MEISQNTIHDWSEERLDVGSAHMHMEATQTTEPQNELASGNFHDSLSDVWLKHSLCIFWINKFLYILLSAVLLCVEPQ